MDSGLCNVRRGALRSGTFLSTRTTHCHQPPILAMAWDIIRPNSDACYHSQPLQLPTTHSLHSELADHLWVRCSQHTFLCGHESLSRYVCSLPGDKNTVTHHFVRSNPGFPADEYLAGKPGLLRTKWCVTVFLSPRR